MKYSYFNQSKNEFFAKSRTCILLVAFAALLGILILSIILLPLTEFLRIWAAVLLYGFEYCFVFISLFLPGYVVLTISSKLSVEERIIASFAITVPTYTLIALVAFIGSSAIASVTLAVILGSSAYFFLRKKMYVDFLHADYKGLAFSVIISILALLYVSLPYDGHQFTANPAPMPDPYTSLNIKVQNLYHTPANDNYWQYRVAQFITNRLDPKTVPFLETWNLPGLGLFERTPLVGLVAAFFFQALRINLPSELLWTIPPANQGLSYQFFQIIASFLNALLLSSSYLLVKRLFSERVAFISILFMIFNPFLFLNTFYTWPKSFVGYFILLAFYFLLQNKATLAGVLAGLAFLVHDLALIFIVGCLVYLFLSHAGKAHWVGFCSTSFLCISAWFGTAYIGFGYLTTFLYYPFAISGIPGHANLDSVISNFLQTPVSTLIYIRIVTAYRLLMPVYLCDMTLNPTLDSTVVPLTYITLPGAIGLSLFPFAYYGVARNLRYFATIIISSLFTPLVMIVLYTGWPGGLFAMHFAETLVPLFVSFGVNAISANRRTLRIAFLTSLVHYFVILAWAYGNNPLTTVSGSLEYVGVIALIATYAAVILGAIRKFWVET